MGEWHLNDPDQQPSPDAEHIDVWKNIENEDRDPRRVLVHQICVYLAVHKRERADGDPKVADEALQEAKTLYDKLRRSILTFRPIFGDGLIIWRASWRRYSRTVLLLFYSNLAVLA